MNPNPRTGIRCKLHVGDQVVVISGSSKGETGKIDRIDFKTQRVYVAGVNIAKRHTKPSMANPQGGIEDKVMPLFWSKVALVDPKTKKRTRIGFKIEGDKKMRIAKKSGTVL